MATESSRGIVTACFAVIDADRERDRAAEAVAALAATGSFVAVAESLTGGAVVADLVRVPGASAVLRGGIVAYDSALKASLLGVPPGLLAEHGAVHPDVAALMAEGVRSAAAVDGVLTDFGLATTGFAGPDMHDGAPVGLVYIAVADAVGTVVHEHRFTGDRATIRAHAARAALQHLADRVTGQADSGPTSSDY